ncbi:glycosyltransferase family 2 protein [Salipiger abyssi]|uniref:glycosyltransferase family 2 protein n=1 Tax=Salipiger abyssi TaxID=1250539 RepID=UPI001A8D694C|nr:glycosyltransferase family 2 protein [Salipiger abyssi]MBN9886275.1 glycosyltransferase family 2 protein [Salipiger abyssi]
MSALIAIPTLNEERHIDAVLDSVAAFASAREALVVVVDGGSGDRTTEIVRDRMQAAPWLRLLDNPARLQSAAVNLAVAEYGDLYDWLIRLDAHSAYPEGYLETLLGEAAATGADSVVVSMHAVGQSPLQKVVAAAQNSRFGNGASAHRNATEGAWVDHGHHALMRIAAFRAVGGYDPEFSHNEDAELDYRLGLAGYRIWLTGRTQLDYFPRSTLRALFRQYFNFGRGRSRNLAKHRAVPAKRQLIVAALAPVLLLSLLAPLHPLFALPVAGWLLACMAAGLLILRECRAPEGLLAGWVAGLMHLAWSAGYWSHALTLPRIHAARRRS